jgi:hypothetical protein
MDYPKKRSVLILGFLLLFTVALAACAQEPEQVEVTRVVEVPVEVPVEVEGPEVEVTRIVEVEAEAPLERGAEVAAEIPFVPLE